MQRPSRRESLDSTEWQIHTCRRSRYGSMRRCDRAGADHARAEWRSRRKSSVPRVKSWSLENAPPAPGVRCLSESLWQGVLGSPVRRTGPQAWLLVDALVHSDDQRALRIGRFAGLPGTAHLNLPMKTVWMRE